MAEAAGLALGAVALASLFKTCVEFFEYFEVARNFSEDGELDGGWDRHTGMALADERCPIARCLLGIKDILGDASKLSTKYGLDKRKRLDWTSCFPIRLGPPQKSKARHFSRIVSLRRHVVWAVHDKRRFDCLIQDLDFFITNLEKVGSPISSLETKINSLVSEISLNSMSLSIQKGNFVSKGHRLGTDDDPGELVENSGSPLEASEKSVKEAPVQGSEYTEQTAEDDARQNVGAVGNVTNRSNKFNGQKAKGRSDQQVGDSTEDFAAAFFAPRPTQHPAEK